MHKEPGKVVKLSVMTADQLFWSTVQVKWAYSLLFETFIHRIGGMHTLISFIGCVKTLMVPSGLKKLNGISTCRCMKTAFRKEIPQNKTILRFVAEELWHLIIEESVSNDKDMKRVTI